jgi:hypothetical protein
MINIDSSAMDMQPDNIQYSSEFYENSTDTTESSDDKVYGSSKLIIGDFIFNDVPFNVSYANNTVKTLSASLKSVGENATGSLGDQSPKGLKQKIILYYKMLDKDTYLLWRNNLNKEVNLSISNTVPDLLEGYTSEYGNSIGNYNANAVNDTYILSDLKYKSTVDSDFHDVTATFYKTVDYYNEDWDSESDEGTLNYIDRETIFDSFNPLEDTVDVLAYINGELIFEGELADVSTSSLKALGKERLLADTRKDVTKYTTTLTEFVEEVMNGTEFFMPNFYDPWERDRLIDDRRLDVEVIDTSVWEVLNSACEDVGARFFCDGNLVRITRPYDVNFDNQTPYDITDFVIKTGFKFKGSKKYNSILMSGNFRFIWFNWDRSTIQVNCYNKMVIAGEGLDYNTMEMVDVNSPVSEEAEFEYVVKLNDNFYDISVSQQKFNFVESTSPDKSYDYWGSLVFEVPIELIASSYRPFGYMTGLNDKPYIVSPDCVTWEPDNLFRTDINDMAELESYPSSYGGTSDGTFYIHIFADSLDELAFFRVYINNIKLVPEDLYDGYRRYLSGDNVYSHSFNFIQTPENLEYLATNILNTENSKLKEITFSCKDKVDVFPGNRVEYGGKVFYVEKVQYKYNKDKSITTDIGGYEFKEEYYASVLKNNV